MNAIEDSGPIRPNVFVLGLVGLALMASASALEAQHVLGRVLSGTGGPLSGAVVQARGTDVWTTTGASGDFMLILHAGTFEVEVSALGYRTAVVEMTVGDEGQTARTDIRLEARPLALDGISVSVLRPDLLPESSLAGKQVEEANPKDAGELLRALNGVEAVRRGPLGLDPVVRGLRETQVGTYLDGARMFPAGPARMDSPLTHLDPSAIRSIEVVKGPYALTWGAGNLSAIRVETQPLPRAESRVRGSLAAGYDTNLGASETTGKAFGKNGPVSYFLHGAFREGNNYESGDGTLVQADFESWEGRGKFGFDLGEGSTLVVSGGYQEQGPIDYQGSLLNAEFFESTNLSAVYTLEAHGRVRGLNLQVYRNNVDHGMTNVGKPTRLPMDGRLPPFALDITVDSHMSVSGGRAAVDLHVNDAWSAQVGGDAYFTNRDADRTIARLDNGMVMFQDMMWPDADISDVGAFARLAYSSRGLRLAGTARGDFVSASAPTASDFFLANVGTDLEAAENNLSGAVTASYDLTGNWTLALGLGSVVRTADASERYSDRIPASKAQMAAEFMGNPNLDPERSVQGDAWLDGRFDRFAVHVGLFGRKIYDYITIQETGLPKRLPLSPNTVFQYINGKATFRGFDASATAALSELVTLDASVSYLHGNDDQLNEPALGVAPLRTSFGVRYEEAAGRFYAEGVVNLVAEQDVVSSMRGEVATGGHQTGDLRAGFGLTNGITVRTGVLNLWDTEYSDHLNAKNPFNGIPIAEPGRVLFLDLAWSF